LLKKIYKKATLQKMFFVYFLDYLFLIKKPKYTNFSQNILYLEVLMGMIFVNLLQQAQIY
jgi:hypothetical protein